MFMFKHYFILFFCHSIFRCLTRRQLCDNIIQKLFHFLCIEFLNLSVRLFNFPSHCLITSFPIISLPSPFGPSFTLRLSSLFPFSQSLSFLLSLLEIYAHLIQWGILSEQKVMQQCYKTLLPLLQGRNPQSHWQMAPKKDCSVLPTQSFYKVNN